MDMSLIRSLETLVLFVLFVGLVYLLYRRSSEKHFEDAANLPFVGDERSTKIEHSNQKVEDHE